RFDEELDRKILDRIAAQELREGDIDYPEDRLVMDSFNTIEDSAVVIWTTTPWTLPGNRAVAFSPRVAYGLYVVTDQDNDFGPQFDDKFILADALAQDAAQKAKIKLRRLRTVDAEELSGFTLSHPL